MGMLRVALQLLLLAFLFGPLTAHGQQDSVPVRIGWQASANAPFFVARNAQLFEKAGLKPIYIKFAAGPQMFAALKSGSIDVVGFGASPFVAGLANGLPIVGILGSYNDSKANLLVARRESNIKSVTDLRGKKVAAAKGSLSFLGLVAALTKHGLTLGDVEYLNMSGTNIISAMQNKDVEAAWVWEPLAQKLMEEQGARPVASLADFGVGGDLWAARTEWIAEHPSGPQRFISAMDSAAKMIQSNPELAIKDIAEALSITESMARDIMKDVDSPTVSEQLDPDSKHSVRHFGTGDKGLAASVKLTADIFLTQGIITSFPQLEKTFDAKHVLEYGRQQRLMR